MDVTHLKDENSARFYTSKGEKTARMQTSIAEQNLDILLPLELEDEKNETKSTMRNHTMVACSGEVSQMYDNSTLQIRESSRMSQKMASPFIRGVQQHPLDVKVHLT